jgi:hypothetical protein
MTTTTTDMIIQLLSNKFPSCPVRREGVPDENVIGIAVFNVPADKEQQVYDEIYNLEERFFSGTPYAIAALVRDRETTVRCYPQYSENWQCVSRGDLLNKVSVSIRVLKPSGDLCMPGKYKGEWAPVRKQLFANGTIPQDLCRAA